MEVSNFSGKTKGKRYPIFPGMRVFVYRNLNAAHSANFTSPVVYSLQARETIALPGFDTLPYGTVFHHTCEAIIEDCEFKVSAGTGKSPYGWRGVRNFGVKNVHAGICGKLLSWTETEKLSGTSIFYNPILDESFVAGQARIPVTAAQIVRCSSSQHGKTVHASIVCRGMK